ncbi:hypothetical protein AADZ91_12665 [Colwelliaceae bacterium 6441]
METASPQYDSTLADDAKVTIKQKRKVGRFLLMALISLIVIIFISNLMLIYSGSNEWEVELEEKGLTIYSLKEPGTSEKKYRITKRYNLGLNQVVSAMLDPSLEQCAAWDPNCYYAEAIEEFNVETLSGINLWRMNMGDLFLPREFLLKTQLSQDPESKSVLIQFNSIMDNEHIDECCIRVDSNISWRFTPVDDGVIEIDYIYDLKFNGAFPAFLSNIVVPEMLIRFFADEVEGLFNMDKFKNAEKLSFITFKEKVDVIKVVEEASQSVESLSL